MGNLSLFWLFYFSLPLSLSLALFLSCSLCVAFDC